MFRLISKTYESVWKRNAIVSICIIVSTWLSTSFAYVEYNTGICYVIRANETMPVVGTKFDSFTELIETCRVFVDKTQLIKEIVALEEPIVLITLPRGWGKTINLEMMKMFFEMKVNKDGTPIPKNMTNNYDFFIKGEITPKGRKTMKLRSPPRISTHEEICKKHMSNYSIVHVDMRFSFSPPNLQETFNHVKMLIGETFDKHEYMVKVLRRIIDNENNTKEVRAKAQKDLIIFEKFLMRGETEIAVLVKSLKFLCRILYQHFGKKVIIMIDNYDYAIVDMFAWVFEPFFYDRYEKVEEDVLRFFGKLMKFTLNENQFMEKAILTGRQHICGEYLFADFNTSIAAFDYFDRGLADYYGFTRLESEQIFMKAEVIVEEKNKATNFYYAYRVDKNTPTYMYNPWDIVSFTEEEKLDSYWLQIGGKYWFPHVLKFKSMYEIFKSLYFGFTWVYADFPNVHLSRGDLVMLGNLFFEAFQNREYPMTPDDIQLLLKYLCSIGYLTSHGFVYDTVLGRDALRLKIPNEEVRNEYKNFTFEMKPPYTWAEPNEA